MTAKSDAQAALAAAMAYRATIAADDADVTVDEMGRRIAALRADLDTSVAALRSTYGVDASAACTALVLVGDRLQQLGEEVAASLRTVVPYTVEQDTNHSLVAVALYEDVTRGPEIVALNRDVISNPNAIPAGTELQVYDR